MNRLVLGIETSCDETSASVVADGRHVLSNIISSQIDLHRKYGGVVPEIASRNHTENVVPVIDAALREANAGLDDLSGVGVTYGPGLVGALLVGVATAKAISFARNIPLIGVHHLEGHIFAAFLSHADLEPPFLALIVSGGHTSLVQVESYQLFRLLGQTRDDAAGEAFDKVARVLGLEYPGGPNLEKLASNGSAEAIKFPRAYTGADRFGFSFSGLKSAVINYLHTAGQKGEQVEPADVAASFQEAVVAVLVDKAMQAATENEASKLVLAGGVAANGYLRKKLAAACDRSGIRLYVPDPVLCTDNAAMIACRAHYALDAGLRSNLMLNAIPYLSLGER